MTDPFLDALAFVLKQEGGWANDPHDPGGETYRGISRRAHPDWDGWKRVDELENKNDFSLTLQLAVGAFYRKHYWDPAGCPQLPPKLALAVFDWAVHSGVNSAVKALQNLVGATADGVFGPKTLASANEYMDRAIGRALVQRRRNHIIGIIEHNRNLERYRLGWNVRVGNLADAIG